jgi:hypothetical protein
LGVVEVELVRLQRCLGSAEIGIGFAMRIQPLVEITRRYDA